MMLIMGNLKLVMAQRLKEHLRKTILQKMSKVRLTQGEVGNMIGMDRRNVNKTLRGTEKKVSLDQFVRIAEGMGLKIDLLVRETKNFRKHKGTKP